MPWCTACLGAPLQLSHLQMRSAIMNDCHDRRGGRVRPVLRRSDKCTVLRYVCKVAGGCRWRCRIQDRRDCHRGAGGRVWVSESRRSASRSRVLRYTPTSAGQRVSRSLDDLFCIHRRDRVCYSRNGRSVRDSDSRTSVTPHSPPTPRAAPADAAEHDGHGARSPSTRDTLVPAWLPPLVPSSVWGAQTVHRESSRQSALRNVSQSRHSISVACIGGAGTFPPTPLVSQGPASCPASCPS